jgi:lipopolysaccharide export system permease protein
MPGRRRAGVSFPKEVGRTMASEPLALQFPASVGGAAPQYSTRRPRSTTLQAVRIIDKYLLREFVWPLVYCFDAFVMLYIVLDLLDNFADFLQYHARIGQIWRYYLNVLPEAFVLIFPMSLLLAVLFCLSNLGKHNELIAMRVSGMSVPRLALPLLITGLISTMIVFAVSEGFVPQSKERSDAFINRLRGKTEKFLIENFFYSNTSERRDWYARRFNTRSREMETLEIHQQTVSNTPLVEVFAMRAQWTNGTWRLLDVDVYDYRQSPPLVTRAAETNFPAFKEPPRQMALEAKKIDYLTTTEMRRTIKSLRAGRFRRHLNEYQVTLDYRYAFPFTCLIVVWLGVPLGMRISRQGPMLGVGTALVLVVTFYFLTHITLALGKGGRIPPAIAAWMTNIIFAGVGAVLFARSR